MSLCGYWILSPGSLSHKRIQMKGLHVGALLVPQRGGDHLKSYNKYPLDGALNETNSIFQTPCVFHVFLFCVVISVSSSSSLSFCSSNPPWSTVYSWTMSIPLVGCVVTDGLVSISCSTVAAAILGLGPNLSWSRATTSRRYSAKHDDFRHQRSTSDQDYHQSPVRGLPHELSKSR